jgi:hypothetical protein
MYMCNFVHHKSHIDMGKPKYSEENMYMCNFVHQKSHIDTGKPKYSGGKHVSV